MKPIKKLLTKLCSVLLPLLGFGLTGCIPAAYGTPHADFRISGKVVDSNNNPIKNIQVTPENDHLADRDTAYTKDNGTFEIKFQTFPSTETTLHFEDIDETENGEYEKLEKKISTKQVKKGKGWYKGVFEAKDVVVTMKEIKKENE